MRVAEQQQELMLGGRLLAPELSGPEEEELILAQRAQVAGQPLLSLRPLLPPVGLVGQPEAPVVGDVLAQRQLAVDLRTRTRGNGAVKTRMKATL